MALCKQYCLRRTKDDELYCAGKQEKMSPGIILSLDFSLVTLLPPVVNSAKASYKKEYLNMPRFLHQGKESKNPCLQ